MRNALLEAEGNEKVEVAKERAEKILDWITSGDGKYDPGAPDSEHYEDNLDSIIKLSMSYGSAGKKPGPEKQELTTMIKAELDTLLRKTEPTNKQRRRAHGNRQRNYDWGKKEGGKGGGWSGR